MMIKQGFLLFQSILTRRFLLRGLLSFLFTVTSLLLLYPLSWSQRIPTDSSSRNSAATYAKDQWADVLMSSYEDLFQTDTGHGMDLTGGRMLSATDLSGSSSGARQAADLSNTHAHGGTKIVATCEVSGVTVHQVSLYQPVQVISDSTSSTLPGVSKSAYYSPGGAQWQSNGHCWKDKSQTNYFEPATFEKFADLGWTSYDLNQVYQDSGSSSNVYDGAPGHIHRVVKYNTSRGTTALTSGLSHLTYTSEGWLNAGSIGHNITGAPNDSTWNVGNGVEGIVFRVLGGVFIKSVDDVTDYKVEKGIVGGDSNYEYVAISDMAIRIDGAARFSVPLPYFATLYINNPASTDYGPGAPTFPATRMKSSTFAGGVYLTNVDVEFGTLTERDPYVNGTPIYGYGAFSIGVSKDVSSGSLSHVSSYGSLGTNNKPTGPIILKNVHFEDVTGSGGYSTKGAPAGIELVNFANTGSSPSYQVVQIDDSGASLYGIEAGITKAGVALSYNPVGAVPYTPSHINPTSMGSYGTSANSPRFKVISRYFDLSGSSINTNNDMPDLDIEADAVNVHDADFAPTYAGGSAVPDRTSYSSGSPIPRLFFNLTDSGLFTSSSTFGLGALADGATSPSGSDYYRLDNVLSSAAEPISFFISSTAGTSGDQSQNGQNAITDSSLYLRDFFASTNQSKNTLVTNSSLIISDTLSLTTGSGSRGVTALPSTAPGAPGVYGANFNYLFQKGGGAGSTLMIRPPSASSSSGSLGSNPATPGRWSNGLTGSGKGLYVEKETHLDMSDDTAFSLYCVNSDCGRYDPTSGSPTVPFAHVRINGASSFSGSASVTMRNTSSSTDAYLYSGTGYSDPKNVATSSRAGYRSFIIAAGAPSPVTLTWNYANSQLAQHTVEGNGATIRAVGSTTLPFLPSVASSVPIQDWATTTSLTSGYSNLTLLIDNTDYTIGPKTGLFRFDGTNDIKTDGSFSFVSGQTYVSANTTLESNSTPNTAAYVFSAMQDNTDPAVTDDTVKHGLYLDGGSITAQRVVLNRAGAIGASPSTTTAVLRASSSITTGVYTQGGGVLTTMNDNAKILYGSFNLTAPAVSNLAGTEQPGFILDTTTNGAQIIGDDTAPGFDPTTQYHTMYVTASSLYDKTTGVTTDIYPYLLFTGPGAGSLVRTQILRSTSTLTSAPNRLSDFVQYSTASGTPDGTFEVDLPDAPTSAGSPETYSGSQSGIAIQGDSALLSGSGATQPKLTVKYDSTPPKDPSATDAIGPVFGLIGAKVYLNSSSGKYSIPGISGFGHGNASTTGALGTSFFPPIDYSVIYVAGSSSSLRMGTDASGSHGVYTNFQSLKVVDAGGGNTLLVDRNNADTGASSDALFFPQPTDYDVTGLHISNEDEDGNVVVNSLVKRWGGGVGFYTPTSSSRNLKNVQIDEISGPVQFSTVSVPGSGDLLTLNILNSTFNLNTKLLFAGNYDTYMGSSGEPTALGLGSDGYVEADMGSTSSGLHFLGGAAFTPSILTTSGTGAAPAGVKYNGSGTLELGYNSDYASTVFPISVSPSGGGKIVVMEDNAYSMDGTGVEYKDPATSQLPLYGLAVKDLNTPIKPDDVTIKAGGDLTLNGDGGSGASTVTTAFSLPAGVTLDLGSTPTATGHKLILGGNAVFNMGDKANITGGTGTNADAEIQLAPSSTTRFPTFNGDFDAGATSTGSGAHITNLTMDFLDQGKSNNFPGVVNISYNASGSHVPTSSAGVPYTAIMTGYKMSFTTGSANVNITGADQLEMNMEVDLKGSLVKPGNTVTGFGQYDSYGHFTVGTSSFPTDFIMGTPSSILNISTADGSTDYSHGAGSFFTYGNAYLYNGQVSLDFSNATSGGTATPSAGFFGSAKDMVILGKAYFTDLMTSDPNGLRYIDDGRFLPSGSTSGFGLVMEPDATKSSSTPNSDSLQGAGSQLYVGGQLYSYGAMGVQHSRIALPNMATRVLTKAPTGAAAKVHAPIDSAASLIIASNVECAAGTSYYTKTGVSRCSNATQTADLGDDTSGFRLLKSPFVYTSSKSDVGNLTLVDFQFPLTAGNINEQGYEIGDPNSSNPSSYVFKPYSAYPSASGIYPFLLSMDDTADATLSAANPVIPDVNAIKLVWDNIIEVDLSSTLAYDNPKDSHNVPETPKLYKATINGKAVQLVTFHPDGAGPDAFSPNLMNGNNTDSVAAGKPTYYPAISSSTDTAEGVGSSGVIKQLFFLADPSVTRWNTDAGYGNTNNGVGSGFDYSGSHETTTPTFTIDWGDNGVITHGVVNDDSGAASSKGSNTAGDQYVQMVDAMSPAILSVSVGSRPVSAPSKSAAGYAAGLRRNYYRVHYSEPIIVCPVDTSAINCTTSTTGTLPRLDMIASSSGSGGPVSGTASLFSWPSGIPSVDEVFDPLTDSVPATLPSGSYGGALVTDAIKNITWFDGFFGISGSLATESPWSSGDAFPSKFSAGAINTEASSGYNTVSLDKNTTDIIFGISDRLVADKGAVKTAHYGSAEGYWGYTYMTPAYVTGSGSTVHLLSAANTDIANNYLRSPNTNIIDVSEAANHPISLYNATDPREGSGSYVASDFTHIAGPLEVEDDSTIGTADTAISGTVEPADFTLPYPAPNTGGHLTKTNSNTDLPPEPFQIYPVDESSVGLTSRIDFHYPESLPENMSSNDFGVQVGLNSQFLEEGLVADSMRGKQLLSLFRYQSSLQEGTNPDITASGFIMIDPNTADGVDPAVVSSELSSYPTSPGADGDGYFGIKLKTPGGPKPTDPIQVSYLFNNASSLGSADAGIVPYFVDIYGNAGPWFWGSIGTNAGSARPDITSVKLVWDNVVRFDLASPTQDYMDDFTTLQNVKINGKPISAIEVPGPATPASAPYDHTQSYTVVTQAKDLSGVSVVYLVADPSVTWNTDAYSEYSGDPKDPTAGCPVAVASDNSCPGAGTDYEGNQQGLVTLASGSTTAVSISTFRFNGASFETPFGNNGLDSGYIPIQDAMGPVLAHVYAGSSMVIDGDVGPLYAAQKMRNYFLVNFTEPVTIYDKDDNALASLDSTSTDPMTQRATIYDVGSTSTDGQWGGAITDDGAGKIDVSGLFAYGDGTSTSAASFGSGYIGPLYTSDKGTSNRTTLGSHLIAAVSDSSTTVDGGGIYVILNGYPDPTTSVGSYKFLGYTTGMTDPVGQPVSTSSEGLSIVDNSMNKNPTPSGYGAEASRGLTVEDDASIAAHSADFFPFDAAPPYPAPYTGESSTPVEVSGYGGPYEITMQGNPTDSLDHKIYSLSFHLFNALPSGRTWVTSENPQYNLANSLDDEFMTQAITFMKNGELGDPSGGTPVVFKITDLDNLTLGAPQEQDLASGQVDTFNTDVTNNYFQPSFISKPGDNDTYFTVTNSTYSSVSPTPLNSDSTPMTIEDNVQLTYHTDPINGGYIFVDDVGNALGDLDNQSVVGAAVPRVSYTLASAKISNQVIVSFVTPVYGIVPGSASGVTLETSRNPDLLNLFMLQLGGANYSPDSINILQEGIQKGSAMMVLLTFSSRPVNANMVWSGDLMVDLTHMVDVSGTYSGKSAVTVDVSSVPLDVIRVNWITDKQGNMANIYDGTKVLNPGLDKVDFTLLPDDLNTGSTQTVKFYSVQNPVKSSQIEGGSTKFWLPIAPEDTHTGVQLSFPGAAIATMPVLTSNASTAERQISLPTITVENSSYDDFEFAFSIANRPILTTQNITDLRDLVDWAVKIWNGTKTSGGLGSNPIYLPQTVVPSDGTSLTINLDLPSRESVLIDVYDSTDRRIDHVFSGTLNEGEHTLQWPIRMHLAAKSYMVVAKIGKKHYKLRFFVTKKK